MKDQSIQRKLFLLGEPLKILNPQMRLLSNVLVPALWSILRLKQLQPPHTFFTVSSSVLKHMEVEHHIIKEPPIFYLVRDLRAFSRSLNLLQSNWELNIFTPLGEISIQEKWNVYTRPHS